ncbi:MAG: MBL fold metallo-hydrolase [Desulfobacter sp.]|nr:MAG: MBL fold metallo-hydrolase [Desulfobacter sp.]
MENGLMQLDPATERLVWNGMSVDFVTTPAGRIRIGSMPDISKLCRRFGIDAGLVVVPPWQGSMAGDNYTGEEFVLWDCQVSEGQGRIYVGRPGDMAVMYGNLDHTFSWFFDPSCTRVEKKGWLSRWFRKTTVENQYTTGDVTIFFDRDCIRILDRGRVVYDGGELDPFNGDGVVEDVLGTVAPDRARRREMEITPVGTGNGFTGTVSSCLVRFGKRVLWIDPGGYPAHTLASRKVHWDDITDLFITHNHEDHVQGISACLSRAAALNRPLHLITAKPVYDVLRQQFLGLFPDFDGLVRFTPVVPGRPLVLGGMELATRWNHHILPYGTLGLKITAGGKTFGFSGDTKLDDTINAVLGREELLPQWFEGCSLVFHEVSFGHPMGVHTHWKEVKKLQGRLDCPVLGYHTAPSDAPPIPLARGGRTYCL